MSCPTRHLAFPALLALAAAAMPVHARPLMLTLAPGWGAGARAGAALPVPAAALQATGCRFAAGPAAARAAGTNLGAAFSGECASEPRRVIDVQASALATAQAAWVDHISLEPLHAQEATLRTPAQPVSETGTWALMLSGVVGVLSLAHRRRPG